MTMNGMTVQKIALACGGQIFGTPTDGEITAVTADSRKTERGCMFAAIVGTRVDGHDFINAAFEAGAACCLCEKVPDNPAGGCIQVADTQRALGEIAAYYRGLFDIPVIAVIGSVGKTTAKEMIYRVLARRFDVLKTEGNLNNELGVPLTLLRLRSNHEVAVTELGISHFGEMTGLAQIAHPTMALFTVIGDAHLEFLHDREGVLKAKSEVLALMPPDGKIFVNGDDPLLAAMPCVQEKITFGTASGLCVTANDIVATASGTKCVIRSQGREIAVEIPAFGSHMVCAALGAAAVGIELGLTDGQIAAGIGDYTPVGDRCSAADTGYITLISDCYNSNPTSCAAGLRSLAGLGGRRVCILGDMLELGDSCAQLHYGIGELAAELGIDLIICCGELAADIRRGAGEDAKYYARKEDLIAQLPTLIHRGDSVLVKASRSMKFEEICEALRGLKG